MLTCADFCENWGSSHHAGLRSVLLSHWCVGSQFSSHTCTVDQDSSSGNPRSLWPFPRSPPYVFLPQGWLPHLSQYLDISIQIPFYIISSKAMLETNINNIHLNICIFQSKLPRSHRELSASFFRQWLAIWLTINTFWKNSSIITYSCGF